MKSRKPRIRREILATMAATMLLAAGFVPAFPQAMSPSVAVADQPAADARVVIAKVVSRGPGFLVVHNQTSDGKVGPVIGWAAVRDGENPGVVVALDATKVTSVLYAMLHVDAGVVGAYEFPGADVPAKIDGMMVNPSFKVSVSGY